jgi:hypothetical protein
MADELRLGLLRADSVVLAIDGIATTAQGGWADQGQYKLGMWQAITTDDMLTIPEWCRLASGDFASSETWIFKYSTGGLVL